MPAHYIRKQTLVNAERYITEELKQFETKVLGAEDARCTLELALFQQLRDQVRAHQGLGVRQHAHRQRVVVAEQARCLGRGDGLAEPEGRAHGGKRRVLIGPE